MASIFSITTSTNNIEIGEQRNATALFTVTNTSGQALTGRAVLVMNPPNEAQAAWLRLKPPQESERSFPINGVQDFIVEVKVPVEAVAGEYLFHLDMLDTNNPDETYAVGPTVKLQVKTPPPPPQPKPFPWWIIAMAVGALAVIGLILFLVFRPRPSPPDLVASADLAHWSSGAGEIPWASSDVDPRGFAMHRDGFRMEDGLTYGLTLETHPEWIDNGFIQGEFSHIYDSGYIIAPEDTFVAKVGFIENGTAGQVIFRVMIRPEGGGNQSIGAVLEGYDGILADMRIPLAPWAGQRAVFILRVEANGSSGQDWATWVVARIERN